MKKLLCLLTFAVPMLCHGQNTNWAFAWPAPTTMPILSSYAPGTNQAYNLYGTTNLGDVITGWPRVAYWTNWTVVTNGSIWFSNSVIVPPGVWYFALTSTNLQGESFFSPVALTGPMPGAPTSLTIQKGQ